MADQPKPPRSTKPLIILVLAVVVIAGTVTAWWFSRPTATNEQTEAALQSAHRSDGANLELLESAYRDAATDEGKAEAATHLAIYYSEQNNHQTALEYFQRVEKLTKTEDINIVLGIAESAKQANHPELAKEYYQKAIDYYNNNPGATTSITVVSRLEEELNKLDGSTAE